jgi:hypothetical protein
LVSNPGTGAWHFGFYGEVCCPSCQTAVGFFPLFSPALLGFMSHLLQAGALTQSHQVTGLCVVFGSFCPQSSLQLGPEVTHCQFVQGDQICVVFPGGSCIALHLQLCLVSSSPSMLGQFSFEYNPLSHETNSGIHHCSALGGWLFANFH